MRLASAFVLALAACAHDDPRISADRAREVGPPATAASIDASASVSASAAPVSSSLRDPFVPGDAK